MKAPTRILTLGGVFFPGAADFGRVRWPHYLGSFVYVALAVAVPSFILMMLLLPRGYDLLIVPAEKRSPLLNVVGAMAFVWFFLLMGLVFTGMYLQRAAAWPASALAHLFQERHLRIAPVLDGVLRFSLALWRAVP